MAVSIRQMKGYVMALQKEKGRIEGLGDELSTIRSRKAALCEAVEADLRMEGVQTLLGALHEMADRETGVYSDACLGGAVERIDAEIRHLNRAIELKEEAERILLEAQARLKSEGQL